MSRAGAGDRRARPRRCRATLNRSGRLWLTAAGAVLVLWAGIVTNQRTFVLVIDIDHAVVEWFAGMRTEVLTDVMQAVHAPARAGRSALFWSTVVALVALRRSPHLFVFLGATLAVTALTGLFAYLSPGPARWAWRSSATGAATPTRRVRSPP